MSTHPVNDQRLRDPEIFFAALFALASVLVGSRALSALVSAADGIAFAPSMMERFGPYSTVANFSTFFVLLPVALAFIAIGIPFALRMLAAAGRRELERRDLLGIGLVVGCLVALIVEARSGGSGLFSFAAMTMLAYWQLWPALARRGRRVGDWCTALAGAAALGLAAYQWSFLSGSEQSLFVAPTFLVVSFYACTAGLALILPAAIVRPRNAPLSALVLTVATTAWLSAPRLRSFSATTGEADLFEFVVSRGGAALLLLGGLAARRRA